MIHFYHACHLKGLNANLTMMKDYSATNVNKGLSPTPGRRQSKPLSTIDKRGSKIDRNIVFDCHLSPVGRQMAIENTVSIDF